MNLSDFTPREAQILQLLRAGLSNKMIAAEIHVCDKTVEFHLANIYSKIGVRSRLQAVVWAMAVQQEQDSRTEN